MSKPAVVKGSVLFFCIGLSFLTGCDLLGIGPKKQVNASKSAEITVAVPASTQEVQGPIPGNALVRIGDWTLTTEEFNNRLNLLKQQLPDFKDNDTSAKNAVLDELIRQELLVKEAEDSGIGESKDIKAAVSDFRRTLMVQELASRLTKDVAATENDAHTYYDANKERFAQPVTWNVSEMVFGDEATAKNVLVQLLQGGDFAQLAQTQSKATDAAQGGKMKPFITGKAPFEAMQTAITNLDQGGISAVFKGPDGYYIAKVDSKTGGDLKSFDDVKKDLIYGLTMQKQQNAILTHLRDLADKYKPEYNKDLIEQSVGKLSQ